MATKSGWTVGFFSDAVREEMEAQHESVRMRFDSVRERIEDEGMLNLPFKYREKVADDIWEMRLRGDKMSVRTLYLQWDGKRVIILVVFAKKSPKIRRHYIRLAQQRAKEVRNA